MHSQSIIHRDIKPSNLIIATNDYFNFSVKIIDFGLSYLKGFVNLLPRIQLGTLAYIAPEMAKNLEYTKVINF